LGMSPVEKPLNALLSFNIMCFPDYFLPAKFANQAAGVLRCHK
jgi:hypothetical protein